MGNIRIAAISGSLRKGSFNTALLHASQKLAPEGMEIVEVSIADLPVYNMDLESDFPATAQRFKDEVNACDGVLFCTPEHNFGYPGPLKNAIDWGSRPYGQGCWDKKPVILQSASPSWTGGLRAQYQLHQVLMYFDMILLRFPEVMVGGAQHKFNEQLELTDPMAIENITKQLNAFKQFVEQHKPA
jgi:chromate reductase